ncbi:MarR family winged helix-turn-helix transcriptional regulator [Streptomyces cinnamoneus]|uniref:MarR family winged helix-turn-helix transcriptional regulator n=1 Tax=Streptomyces cinnamoneus TaxID=53446 RepID=UPI0037A410F5
MAADDPADASPDRSGQPAAVPSLPFALLLVGAGRLVQDEVNRRLEARGHSLRLMGALGHLAHEPGLSYSELGRRAGVTAQSMQATVLRLEQAGAVARTSPAGRGRTAHLHVTEEGRRMLEDMRHTLAGVEEPLLDGLSAAERAALGTALPRLLGNVGRLRRAGPDTDTSTDADTGPDPAGGGSVRARRQRT